MFRIHRSLVLLAFMPAFLVTALPAVVAADAARAGATRINPKDGAEMVYVPAGRFVMGDASLDRAYHNCPRRRVTLDAFWIYKNDVTVAQYRKFCEATGAQMPDAPEWGWKDDNPMVNVSWDDAKAYCDWAATALPTEAQWEKAARGTDGHRYPWGNDFDGSKLWRSKNKTADAGSTGPVGSIAAGASPYGCLDMAGNVWQWRSDWYNPDYYKTAPSNNPTGPTSGKTRLLRGGSWDDYAPVDFQSARRVDVDPGARYHSNGFRAVQADAK